MLILIGVLITISYSISKIMILNVLTLLEILIMIVSGVSRYFDNNLWFN